MTPLPIDAHIAEIVARTRETRALVLTATPGAGKTTRVPPALADDGPVIVLQPRRVAARSIARRIATERGWTLGREVGWHVRFERQFGPSTRVLLATEGILTARLQQDPLLSDFRTVILDEFHERTVHADLGIALVRQAWLARDDLRIVIMSATIDASAVASYLDGCPVIEIAGRTHALEIQYAPQARVGAAVDEALTLTAGQVLCFLPGAPEIRRAEMEIAHVAARHGADVVALHGALPPDQQDAAIAEVSRRRVILSTNIAETSLTVPGVTAVIDSGLHKVARYDPGRAIDSLLLERITQDSADQRAGRAGRIASGKVWRLWSATDRLRRHAEAEIHRIDLAGPILSIVAWGGDPRTLEWLEPPPSHTIDAAFELLHRLGALDATRLTDVGGRMQHLPLHPRLARILLAGDGARDVALACAILSERGSALPASLTSSSDLLSAIDAEPALAPHVLRVAGELTRLVKGRSGRLGERAFRRALLTGYPDRVARRRTPGSPRVLLASGHGAQISSESAVRVGEFIVAIDVTAAQPADAAEARIRLASVVEREWLQPTEVKVEHLFDEEAGVVRAVERDYYGAIVLAERVVPASDEQVAVLLAEAYTRRNLDEHDEQLLRRLRFAGVTVDLNALLRTAAYGKRSLRDVRLDDAIAWDVRTLIDREAPVRLPLPSGRSARLDYREDGVVVASVKLQELFGVTETPRIGSRQAPVLLALLAPNGRPVQMTQDLRSFWERTYPEVRKELRGRYPRHKWPETP